MQQNHAPQNHYRRLLLMLGVSFGSMYVLMYAMVDNLNNIQHNLNQVYMAGLMTAPMLILELLMMGSLYPNKQLNAVLISASVLAGLLFFMLIRQQTAISDAQFLRSMIPHHAGAILMCEQASLQDPENQKLCAGIITSQQAEIEQMKAKLQELEK